MASKPQTIESVDIGFSRGLHVHVDLLLDEATLYYLWPSGRTREFGTVSVDEMMEILSAPRIEKDGK